MKYIYNSNNESISSNLELDCIPYMLYFFAFVNVSSLIPYLSFFLQFCNILLIETPLGFFIIYLMIFDH